MLNVEQARKIGLASERIAASSERLSQMILQPRVLTLLFAASQTDPSNKLRILTPLYSGAMTGVAKIGRSCCNKGYCITEEAFQRTRPLPPTIE